MKFKNKTIYLKRAREAKKWKELYFGRYLQRELHEEEPNFHKIANIL